MQWPYFYHVRSMLEQRLGHRAASLQDAERAMDLARELTLPSLQLPHFLARVAQARSASRDPEGAMRAADEAITLPPAFQRVALGGVNVDSQQLTSALWPDADGAAAKTSFDSTLFRLRKLLDVENALVLSAGKLSLAHSLVWTDVWALDAAFDAAQPGSQAEGSGAPAERLAARVLDAYPGPLLGADEHPWIAKPRDALRARFVRTLMRLGEQLEAKADWAHAIDVYRRGLEADNLAESFYRGLMRALAATGDQAEALNAFRRCRELLSIVLGIKPSAETDRLYREIAAGAAR